MKRFIYVILFISVAGAAYAGKPEKRENKREVIFKERVPDITRPSSIIGKHSKIIDAYSPSLKKVIGRIAYVVRPWDIPMIDVVAVDDGEKRKGVGTGLVKEALINIKKRRPNEEKVGIKLVLEESKPFWRALGAQAADKNHKDIDFYLSLK